MNDLEQRAKAFAERHHGAIQQVRKYTGEPYVHHPAAVAELVRSVPHTPEMIAAAWLHDTVEDTEATLEEIHYQFGAEVASLVEMLTDVSRPEDGNRAARKALDREHSAQASPEGKTVKLADLLDNADSIIQHDPHFSKVFLREAAQLLALMREGDATLWTRLAEVIRRHAPKAYREFCA